MIKNVLYFVLIALFLANNVLANGVSFYERIGVIKEGELEFLVVARDKLPRSNQIILSMKSWLSKDEKDKLVSQLSTAIENEMGEAKDNNIKAWKMYLRGIVYFELRMFDKSITPLGKTVSLTTDTKLKAAALHRLISVHGVLRDADSSIKTIELFQTYFPNYERFDSIFNTYPYGLCESAWDECIGPTSGGGAKMLSALIPKLRKIKELQKKIVYLSKNKNKNKEEFVTANIKLGKLYESYCVAMSMFNNVCPDALDIYKSVYEEFPKIIGSDYAYLKIMYSKFAYEYEGDEIAYSKDIVKYYGSFLQKYPNSPHSKSIKERYDKAMKILNDK